MIRSGLCSSPPEVEAAINIFWLNTGDKLVRHLALQEVSLLFSIIPFLKEFSRESASTAVFYLYALLKNRDKLANNLRYKC